MLLVSKLVIQNFLKLVSKTYFYISNIEWVGFICTVDILIPYPPHGRLMEIPRGRGFQKPNFLKESMALKWNFWRGWGVEAKKPSVGGVWIFSGTTHRVIPEISIPTPWKVNKNSKGERSFKSIILESMVLKWNFQRGAGSS